MLFADLEREIEKIDVCKNNPESVSTTKVSNHIPSSFSISILKDKKYRKVRNHCH